MHARPNRHNTQATHPRHTTHKQLTRDTQHTSNSPETHNTQATHPRHTTHKRLTRDTQHTSDSPEQNPKSSTALSARRSCRLFRNTRRHAAASLQTRTETVIQDGMRVRIGHAFYPCLRPCGQRTCVLVTQVKPWLRPCGLICRYLHV